MAIKTVLIFLLIALIANGCGYGQYPKLRIDSNGRLYNANHPLVEGEGHPRPVTIQTYPVADSSKYYWQRFNKYNRLMNQELEKINRFQNPQMTRKIFRYQDSCNRYQELLSRLKK